MLFEHGEMLFEHGEMFEHGEIIGEMLFEHVAVIKALRQKTAASSHVRKSQAVEMFKAILPTCFPYLSFVHTSRRSLRLLQRAGCIANNWKIF